MVSLEKFFCCSVFAGVLVIVYYSCGDMIYYFLKEVIPFLFFLFFIFILALLYFCLYAYNNNNQLFYSIKRLHGSNDVIMLYHISYFYPTNVIFLVIFLSNLLTSRFLFFTPFISYYVTVDTIMYVNVQF